jgi:hypothetical protein
LHLKLLSVQRAFSLFDILNHKREGVVEVEEGSQEAVQVQELVLVLEEVLMVCYPLL